MPSLKIAASPFAETVNLKNEPFLRFRDPAATAASPGEAVDVCRPGVTSYHTTTRVRRGLAQEISQGARLAWRRLEFLRRLRVVAETAARCVIGPPPAPATVSAATASPAEASGSEYAPRAMAAAVALRVARPRQASPTAAEGSAARELTDDERYKVQCALAQCAATIEDAVLQCRRTLVAAGVVATADGFTAAPHADSAS